MRDLNGNSKFGREKELETIRNVIDQASTNSLSRGFMVSHNHGNHDTSSSNMIPDDASEDMSSPMEPSSLQPSGIGVLGGADNRTSTSGHYLEGTHRTSHNRQRAVIVVGPPGCVPFHYGLLRVSERLLASARGLTAILLCATVNQLIFYQLSHIGASS